MRLWSLYRDIGLEDTVVVVSSQGEDSGVEGYDGSTRPTILLLHFASCTCRTFSCSWIRCWGDGNGTSEFAGEEIRMEEK